MVDITDQPHQELVRAVRDVSKKVYEMHFQEVKMDKKAMPGSI